MLTSHAVLEAQVSSLVRAWEWTAEDAILHVLPLHHVHGVVNALLCCLQAGAHCHFLDSRFDARRVWAAFDSLPLTLFMAVPTVYSRLIAAFDAASQDEQRRWRRACSKLRLMVSGSAALPAPVLRRWQSITGHVLLERYGMTEIGMALSNPLHGVRKEGSVGAPLPGVQVRIRPLEAPDGRPASASSPQAGAEGELLVKGPTVFSQYLNRPEASAAAFDSEGWFLTGDVVRVDAEGDFSIVGRAAVDVLKVGGYKVQTRLPDGTLHSPKRSLPSHLCLTPASAANPRSARWRWSGSCCRIRQWTTARSSACRTTSSASGWQQPSCSSQALSSPRLSCRPGAGSEWRGRRCRPSFASCSSWRGTASARSTRSSCCRTSSNRVKYTALGTMTCT